MNSTNNPPNSSTTKPKKAKRMKLPKKEEIDSQLYLPRLLYLRLERREKLKAITALCFIFDIALVIISIVFLDSVRQTRSYLGVDSDEFWSTFKVEGIEQGNLQLYLNFSGFFTLVVAFFNIMNLTNILFLSHYGGLKNRLKLAWIFHFIINTAVFINSVIFVVMFKFLVILIPIYTAIAFVNLLLMIVLIVICTKTIRKELEFMLPVDLMRDHKVEYYMDYITKTKKIVDVNKIEEQIPNDDEQRIYIKN